MPREAALLLLTLGLVSGCYRVVHVRGHALARPMPLASGTYWTSEGGAVVSSARTSSTSIAASVDTSVEATVVIEGRLTESVVVVDERAGSWSASGGWSGSSASGTSGAVADASGASGVIVDASGGASGASGVIVDASGGASGAIVDVSGGRFGVDVPSSLPPRGAEVTGAGLRLAALGTIGITVDCARGSCTEGGGAVAEGELAALARLVPLGAGALDVDALVTGDAHVRIEAALAHEGLPAAGGDSEIVLRVRGGEAPAVTPPLRVHLVIDASTSMERRWDAVKDAAVALIGTLRPEDELQIVVYGTDASVAMPACRVGDGARARRIVRGLELGGRTNIEAGLRAAYAEAAPSGGSIVLLLSDGVPQGGAGSAAELGAITAQAFDAHATTTVAVGLGVDFSAEVLQAIATAGHGDFRMAPSIAALPALLSAEIDAHGRVVARDVAVEVTLAGGVTLDAEAAASLGATVTEGGARVVVPAVTAGAELTWTLPVHVGGSAIGHDVATVSAVFAGGHGDKTLGVARASRPAPAGSLRASLDVDLSAVLERVADAVENGEGALAAALLEAHAREVEALLSIHADAGLRERATASRAVAWSLRTCVPEASWPERRTTAAQILAWSVRLGR